jgi:hypothetical protein
MPITSAGGLPAIRVADVLVFAYVKDGLLRVSVDLDEAADSWPTADSGGVPMRICVQGHVVFEADEQGHETAGPGQANRRNA